jgi:hypothetical protein
MSRRSRKRNVLKRLTFLGWRKSYAEKKGGLRLLWERKLIHIVAKRMGMVPVLCLGVFSAEVASATATYRWGRFLLHKISITGSRLGRARSQSTTSRLHGGFLNFDGSVEYGAPFGSYPDSPIVQYVVFSGSLLCPGNIWGTSIHANKSALRGWRRREELQSRAAPRRLPDIRGGIPALSCPWIPPQCARLKFARDGGLRRRSASLANISQLAMLVKLHKRG